jgi:sugar phosphate isomerase/epimerase
MQNTISFMSANYVARQVGYNMTGGWGQGDKTTSAHFEPIETFPQRFEELLQDIRAMGYRAMDLWNAHLSYTWATRAHLDAARELLDRYQMPVISLAGWFGSTREEFEATCRVATAVGCKILGGSTSMWQKEPDFVAALLEEHDLTLGLENHPEKDPQELLARVGDGAGGRVGVCVDTGWFGTQGYDAARALEELRGHHVHVHLKDVLAVGAHDTCRYGRGVVPIEECLRVLARIGYRGGISMEHEPELFDPTEDSIANLQMLRDWMQQSQSA